MRVVRYGMSPTAGRRPGGGSTGSDGIFQASINSLAELDAPRSTREAHAPTSTQSLLALQENVSEKLGRRKKIQQGFDLLRGLDQLHRDLFTGDASPETVTDLAKQLRQFQVDPDEPELASILKEIELRCAVELAKLSLPAAG